jgi:hypothetical protein
MIRDPLTVSLDPDLTKKLYTAEIHVFDWESGLSRRPRDEAA